MDTLLCANCGYEIENASEQGFCSTCERAYQLGKRESL
jgi:NMD protein affecting ribosome stability and mRNA decay